MLGLLVQCNLATGSAIPGECCACGVGKYSLNFTGLWSPQTHPKDFPTQRYIVHWSNVVGASHDKQYSPWRYGEQASRGVKEVCEYGYASTMVDEIQRAGSHVRSLVKTPPIWWREPQGVRGSLEARFSVDNRRHLFTFLTMLGPSPDWCVGVSGLDLCQADCTWKSDVIMELYPWDAGTDDGVSYMSKNAKSEPQQRIHNITHRFPSNPESPFYGPKPILPLATISLKRIGPSPLPGSAQCDVIPSVSDVDVTDDVSEGGQGMMKKDMCVFSEWMDWSECSATCALGQRVRKRKLMSGDESQCDGRLMETENCIGVENECEPVGGECAVTSWSEWSPCSMTCGQGTSVRLRRYLNPADEGVCRRAMREVKLCAGEVTDCRRAAARKDYTVICRLPPTTGPCRGNFQRWHYDVTMHKCLPFTYGGCRGNENRFFSMDECTTMCAGSVPSGPSVSATTSRPTTTPSTSVRRTRVNCVVSPWEPWSSCSVTCGTGTQARTRFITQQPIGAGTQCPRTLETRSCKLAICRGQQQYKV